MSQPQVIEDKMDIRGGYAKPKWTDVLWVQLLLLPLTAARWSYFYGRWLWQFGVCRREYGEGEKLYVIRRNMGLSQLQFDVSAYCWKDLWEFLGEDLGQEFRLYDFR